MPGANAGSGRALADPAKRGARWGDLRLRVISAVLLAPVVLACLWVGGPYWGALVAIAAMGLALEWVALCGAAFIAHVMPGAQPIP